MGLMLSVLVFCVGVLEALSCLEHIRNSYLPFELHHTKRKRRLIVDINTGKARHVTSSGAHIHQHHHLVDAVWPGDVPRNQHVILKRSGYVSTPSNSLDIPDDIDQMDPTIASILASECIQQLDKSGVIGPLHTSGEPTVPFTPEDLQHALSSALFERDEELIEEEEEEDEEQVVDEAVGGDEIILQPSSDGGDVASDETSSGSEELTEIFKPSPIHSTTIVTNNDQTDVEEYEDEEDTGSSVGDSLLKKDKHMGPLDLSNNNSNNSNNTSNVIIKEAVMLKVDDDDDSSKKDGCLTTPNVDDTLIKSADQDQINSDAIFETDLNNTITTKKIETKNEINNLKKTLDLTTEEIANISSTVETAVLSAETHSKKITQLGEDADVSSNEKIISAKQTEQTLISSVQKNGAEKPMENGGRKLVETGVEDESKSSDAAIVEREVENENDKQKTTDTTEQQRQEKQKKSKKSTKKSAKKQSTVSKINQGKIETVENSGKREEQSQKKIIDVELVECVIKRRDSGDGEISPASGEQKLSDNQQQQPSVVKQKMVKMKSSFDAEQTETPVGGKSQTINVKPSEPKSKPQLEPMDDPTSPDKAFWLIFSGEYTKAMSKDWHSGHFCCWQCDESLTGQRYVLRDDHPYCIKCYESVFANTCDECNKTIGIDSKDLSYKDKHWHEACFFCNKCRVSLVDKQFGSKADKIYCGNCYDAQFASRCDGCGQIFRAGTKKMEYKTRQWHEQCFCCCVCKTPIGTKSFIPREQEIYCATCYEEKFATRCVKCNKIITSGGVTYKNEPWHRECFTCTNCNTSLAGQRFTSREEKPYCADCFGELFAKRCTACCKPITGIGGTRFISFEDRHWHNDCFICAACKSSLVGRGFITDAEDILCTECAKQKLM